MRPIDDDWHKQSAKKCRQNKAGSIEPDGWGGELSRPSHDSTRKPPTYETHLPAKKNSATEIKQHSSYPRKKYQTRLPCEIRIVYIGKDEETARVRMQGIVGSFKQFNSTKLNGFQSKIASYDRRKIDEYRHRQFNDSGFILNIESSPASSTSHTHRIETPNIVWAHQDGRAAS